MVRRPAEGMLFLLPGATAIHEVDFAAMEGLVRADPMDPDIGWMVYHAGRDRPTPGGAWPMNPK